MNEEVEQNAEEIEQLFRGVYWSTEYNGHDVIGRWVPPADHTTQYGIVAVESVVWDWQNRSLQEKDSANFQNRLQSGRYRFEGESPHKDRAARALRSAPPHHSFRSLRETLRLALSQLAWAHAKAVGMTPSPREPL
jgi:hypothetical protein